MSSPRLLLLAPLLLLSACARPPEASAPGSPAPLPAPSGPPEADGGTELQCREDADCALTRVPTDGCCETLCAPRAVTITELAALTRAQRECEAQRGPCPEPVCPPPRFLVMAACRDARCVPLQQPNE